jgi:RNA polymerase sigma-70 factor (ECF subfamily)
MSPVQHYERRWASYMRAANEGCSQSYERLLTELADVLRRFVQHDLARAGLRAVEPEDIVQETLLAIHLKRHTWDASRPILPWIRAIIRHKTIDMARRRGRAREVPIDQQAELIPAAPERLPVASLDRNLNELPARQREVVTALAVHGESVREAAQRLNMRPGAVRTAMHRGLAALAARFADWVP